MLCTLEWFGDNWILRFSVRWLRLGNFYFTEKYNGIKPALVLVFDDLKHPVMPIREHRWAEYLQLLDEYENRQTR